MLLAQPFENVIPMVRVVILTTSFCFQLDYRHDHVAGKENAEMCALVRCRTEQRKTTQLFVVTSRYLFLVSIGRLVVKTWCVEQLVPFAAADRRKAIELKN